MLDPDQLEANFTPLFAAEAAMALSRENANGKLSLGTVSQVAG
jgi:hypothetical protein